MAKKNLPVLLQNPVYFCLVKKLNISPIEKKIIKIFVPNYTQFWDNFSHLISTISACLQMKITNHSKSDVCKIK